MSNSLCNMRKINTQRFIRCIFQLIVLVLPKKTALNDRQSQCLAGEQSGNNVSLTCSSNKKEIHGKKKYPIELNMTCLSPSV